jgi:integrase
MDLPGHSNAHDAGIGADERKWIAAGVPCRVIGKRNRESGKHTYACLSADRLPAFVCDAPVGSGSDPSLCSGQGLRVIQAYLGHSSPTTTAIYTHLTQPMEEKVLETVSATLESVWG